MQLSLAGINHQTAPLAVREKAAISTGKLSDSLLWLHARVPQGIVLSTCNRTEIYLVTQHNADPIEKTFLEFLKTLPGVPVDDLQEYVYTYRGTEAARHLFRVACGLDSMIVGEFEVLGQVRQALEEAEKSGMMGLPLRQAFLRAIRTGRLVRDQTGISRNALSASSVAVDLASRVVGDLNKCMMLVIGSGEAGRLVVKVARERGVSQIVIASRTRDRAQTLASLFNGIPADLDDLDNELNTANIVVTCAGSPHRILSLSRVREAMQNRPGRPLVIIDIAIPRDVEPEVGHLKDVFLYNMDDLTAIADANRQQRENEVHRAEQIVVEEVDKFDSWWHELDIRPVVGALMSRAEDIRLAQMNKTLKRLPPMSAEQRENLEAMTKSIVSQILKDPVRYLKTGGNVRDAEIVKELFNLRPENLP